MNGETQSKIQKLLYNLSTQEYAKAEKGMKDILAEKIKTKFNSAYAEVEAALKKKVVKENHSGETHPFISKILAVMDDANVVAEFNPAESKVEVQKHNTTRDDDYTTTIIDLKFSGKVAEQIIASMEEFKNSKYSAFQRISRRLRYHNEGTTAYGDGYVKASKVVSPNVVLLRFELSNGVG